MNRSTLSLATFAAAVAILAIWRALALFGDPLPAPGAAPAWTPQSALQAQRPASAHATATVRPLFSRQDASPQANDARPDPAAGRTAESASLPRLVGVIADGDRRVAIIAHQGVIVRAREKSRVGEWTVVRIEPRSALVRTTTKSEMLWLDPARSKGADFIAESQ